MAGTPGLTTSGTELSKPTALVTGATGQDAHYLAEQLSGAGYVVVGTSRGVRQDPSPHFDEVVALDLRGDGAIRSLLERLHPALVFNMAAYSTGAGMYDDGRSIGEVNGLAVTSLLEAIRAASPSTRLLQASSSEMFGTARESPQSEETPFLPRSPYGAAKVYAHTMVRIYRERYGLFACSAILFNHESPYRGTEFVSRKISRGAAMIALGLASKLRLGNLQARRDWGFAGDYARAMRLMLDGPAPVDYVVASGETHSVEDMCRIAFDTCKLDFRDHVEFDPASYRPSEPVQLMGNPARIERDLGWRREVAFEKMVAAMVQHDLRLLSDPRTDNVAIAQAGQADSQ